MSENINILYVDDLLDRGISGSLESYSLPKVIINYDEIEFENAYDYKKLIDEIDSRNINLLVIDSSLYLEGDIRKRFTGEEFKIILKKLLPFVETIVVSQNKQENNYDIIKKYNVDEHSETPLVYYNSILGTIVAKKINEIIMGREILGHLKEQKTIDASLIESISLSLDGLELFSELNSEDIDKFIKEFQELKQVVVNG